MWAERIIVPAPRIAVSAGSTLLCSECGAEVTLGVDSCLVFLDYTNGGLKFLFVPTLGALPTCPKCRTVFYEVTVMRD